MSTSFINAACWNLSRLATGGPKWTTTSNHLSWNRWVSLRWGRFTLGIWIILLPIILEVDLFESYPIVKETIRFGGTSILYWTMVGVDFDAKLRCVLNIQFASDPPGNRDKWDKHIPDISGHSRPPFSTHAGSCACSTQARPGAWDAEKVAVLMLPEVQDVVKGDKETEDKGWLIYVGDCYGLIV